MSSSRKDISHSSIRHRNTHGLGHIPEDRHKHGLVLDYPLSYNLVLQSYFEPEFCQGGFLKYDKINQYAEKLIRDYDIRSGQGGRPLPGLCPAATGRRPSWPGRSTATLISSSRSHRAWTWEPSNISASVAERDKGKGVLFVLPWSWMRTSTSDRILVIYEGEIVADLDPKEVTIQELGLYMAGSKRKGHGQ